MDRQRVGRAGGNSASRVGASRRRWERITQLARRQHAVVTREQLLQLGLTGYTIDSWVKAGRLRPLRRSVYLVGPTVGQHTYEMAAVLALAPGAVVSHRTAAHLWRLLPYPAQDADLHITISGRNPGARPCIKLHRPVIPIAPRDIGSVERIPVTKPARTLIDIAASCAPRELEQALAEAYARRLAGPSALQAVVTRYAGAQGAARLLRLLEKDAKPALTRSQAERRLLELVRKAKLPSPEANIRVAGYKVDFLWRAERLIVEVGGFQFHSSRAAFERDRVRDAELQAQGFRVMRVTWRQLMEEPAAAIARIARALVVVRG